MKRPGGPALGLGVAVGGALVAGAGVALARRRPRVQPPVPAPPTRSRTVPLRDGVPMATVEYGPPDAALTLVLVHGFTLSGRCWQFQAPLLAARGYRVLLPDLRAHGSSGASPAETCTIDQLGEDLETLIEALVPTGPVVLVGHSMGGMATLALADRRPEWFAAGGRIVGVGLMSTSSGQLASVTFGLPAAVGLAVRRVAPRALTGLGRIRRGRTAYRSTPFSRAVTGRLSFGGPVDPAAIALMEQMVALTPLDVVAAFLPTFLTHDKLAALPHLAARPVLILCGDADLLTPVEHSATMAEHLPDAELVVVPGVGHMVMLERPDLVTDRLGALAERASAALSAGSA